MHCAHTCAHLDILSANLLGKSYESSFSDLSDETLMKRENLATYSRMRKTDMRKTDTFSEISRTFDMHKSDTFSEISRFFFQNIGKMTFDLFNLFWNYNFHGFQQTLVVQVLQ